ncbi:MAG: Rpn family recombination-promoting nuclease/putative transposase [Treponema sp.]|nr:Rpn family recombination-promoting nuclease/putative transposase [Treponema sp.]
MKNKDIFISPLEDFAFKQIFGEQRNIDNTKAFLKAVLNLSGDEIGKLTVTNPILKKFFRKDKSGIVDIKLEAKSGKIFHIELQVEKKANMRNRVLYYGARLIGDQLKWGEDYRKLHHVVSIVICDHVLLEEESSYMNVYKLMNEKNRTFTDLLKVIIIELPKLSDIEDENGIIWRWLRFLKCKKKEEYVMLAKKYPELKKPIECARRMGLIESIRDYYFHKNLAKIDDLCLKEQWMIDGRAEGMAQGLAEGKAQGKAEIIALLEKGLSLEDIKKHIGD